MIRVLVVDDSNSVRALLMHILGTAPGLALPGRVDTPGGLALRGVVRDAGAQCREGVDVAMRWNGPARWCRRR